MSSRVSIWLVGFVAVIRLSLTVWQGKHLNSSCLLGQTVKLSRIMATKPTSKLNKSTRLAKTFQQFGFSTLSRQTNRQVEWILDYTFYSDCNLPCIINFKKVKNNHDWGPISKWLDSEEVSSLPHILPLASLQEKWILLQQRILCWEHIQTWGQNVIFCFYHRIFAR